MGILVISCGLWASVALEIMIGPRSGITVDRCQCCFIDRQSFISSTTSSREVDWPIFNKTCITSATGCWLTSNWRNWKANAKLYIVFNDGLNITVGRSPYIDKHMTRMCRSAPQTTPNSPYISRTYLNL